MSVTFSADGNTATMTVESNGNVFHYTRHEGIYFNDETPPEVIRALLEAKRNHYRIRVHLGYTDPKETAEKGKQVGQDWLDTCVEGYVGNSTGPLKSPLLVYNARSSGGGAIMTNHIVKIRITGKNGRTLYQHPHYHTGKFTLEEVNETVGKRNYRAVLKVNGETEARFETMAKAQKWLYRHFGVDVIAT